MDITSVIGSIIMFVVAFGCLIISFLQFVEKMPLLNNTYIWSFALGATKN